LGVGKLVNWELVNWVVLLAVGFVVRASAEAHPKPAQPNGLALGEPVRAEWVAGDAPESGWTVGDRIPLQLSATFPMDLEVTLPELPAQWGPFEVFEQRVLPPADNGDGTLTVVREATVTLWAPGEHETPPLAVRYRKNTADEWREISAPPITITVASVLAAGDTEKRDLKPQVRLPRPPLWPWVSGGVVLACLVGLAGWFLLTHLRRRMPLTAGPAPVFDPRPPHEIAYAELARIETLDLPVHGELKRHYTLIADCLRDYVERRYHVPALDQTTAELLVALRQMRVERDHVGLFREWLSEADLVKFARLRPPVEQARAAVGQAQRIVDVTRDE